MKTEYDFFIIQNNNNEQEKKRKRSLSPVKSQKKVKINEVNIYKQKKFCTDLKIIFNNSNNFIYIKKSIISSFSPTIKDYLEKDSTLEILLIHENEKIFNDLIKYMYTGEINLETRTNEEIIQILYLIHKYSMKIKLPPCDILLNVISYIDKDINKRFKEFDFLLNLIDFRLIEKKILISIYLRYNRIKKSVNFLNRIIEKNFSDY
jgi:hypothetical protein